MNAEQLLAHFDRIADSPDAIPRLRRFILDLAVRGKLVPQDPKGEPASELLKRIAAEKTRLVKAGEVKNQSDLPLVATCETPFSIPDAWEWTRIGSAAYVEMGQSPPSEHYNRIGHGIPFFQGKTDFGKRSPTARYWCTEPKKYAASGDILISVRAPVGPTNIASELCCIGRGLAALRPYRGIDRDYFLHGLEAFELVLDALGCGSTFVAINKKQLASFVIPLPPLAEQHRIVAKVDELMALCDRLETSRVEREAKRDQMTTASLARLNAPDPAPETFQNHAAFVLNNLIPLTTRPDQIKALRQTILNLAVRGKLVPQDPNDEPSTSLLGVISATREEMFKAGQIKRAKKLLPIIASEVLYDIPKSWSWVQANVLWDFENGDRSKNYPSRVELVDDGIPFVNAGHLVSGRVSMFQMNFITPERYQRLSGGKLKKGDQIYCLRGSLGKHAIYNHEGEGAIASSLVILRPIEHQCVPYLFIYLESDFAKQMLRRFDNGSAQPNLSSANLRKYEVPLPPLAEQHRIVAKVDELMALCDQLEASLTTGNNTRRHLLDALLHEALAPHGKHQN